MFEEGGLPIFGDFSGARYEIIHSVFHSEIHRPLYRACGSCTGTSASVDSAYVA